MPAVNAADGSAVQFWSNVYKLIMGVNVMVILGF